MKMVCIGDSLTYGYGVKRASVWTALVSHIRRSDEIVNKGVNGDTTGGMLARFDRDVLMEKPDQVFLMGGSNDIFFARDIAGARSNVPAMVWRSIHEGITPVVGVPFPVFAKGLAPEWAPFADGEEVQKLLRRYREWLLEFGREFGIHVIDFFKCIPEDGKERAGLYLDGIHLNERGHRLAAGYWCGELWPVAHRNKSK